MGRWAESEFDRVLIDKVKQLFDSCRDPLVESSSVDLRFRTFVRTLDPSDKAIQACFRTLIQQSHLTTARSRRNRRPISDYVAQFDPQQLGSAATDAIRSRSPPPRLMTRSIRTRHYDTEPATEDSVVDPRPPRIRLSALGGRIIRPESPSLGPSRGDDYSTHPLLPRHRPSVAGPSSSRPHSPSRMRRLGLDPAAATFVPGAGARPPSPPSAASRAWLDEYAPVPGPSPEEDEANITAYLSQPPPVPYVPGSLLGTARRRRRDDMLEVLENLRANQRRRLERRRARGDRPASPEVDSEVEAMFGSYNGGGEDIPSGDDEDDMGIFMPTTYAPQPGPAAGGNARLPSDWARPPSAGAGDGDVALAPLRERMRQRDEARLTRAAAGMPRLEGQLLRARIEPPEPFELEHPLDAPWRDRRRDGLVLDLGDEPGEGGSAFERAMRMTRAAQESALYQDDEMDDMDSEEEEALYEGYHGASVDWY